MTEKEVSWHSSALPLRNDQTINCEILTEKKIKKISCYLCCWKPKVVFTCVWNRRGEWDADIEIHTPHLRTWMICIRLQLISHDVVRQRSLEQWRSTCTQRNIVFLYKMAFIPRPVDQRVWRRIIRSRKTMNLKKLLWMQLWWHTCLISSCLFSDIYVISWGNTV